MARPRLYLLFVALMLGLSFVVKRLIVLGRIPLGTIPLNLIYSTNGQKGIKQLTAGFQFTGGGGHVYVETYGANLEQINSHLMETQRHAPYSFLAVGDDITEAMAMARVGFTGLARLDRPVVQTIEGSSEKKHWLVAYVGTDGSSPPAFLATSAQLE